jgi:hypothetical protein
MGSVARSSWCCSAIAEGLAVDASLITADANKRRSVREYLDKLDEAAWGAASDAAAKSISPSDPAAQWTGAHKGRAFFAYADNYVIDYVIDLKAVIIIDVEATRAGDEPRWARREL